MRVNLGIWDNLNRAVVILLFVVGGCGAFFWYLPVIYENTRYRKEIQELDAKIVEESRVSKHLNAAIDAQQRDPNMLERLAREKLGYARTNETVIRFEPAERLQRVVQSSPRRASAPAPSSRPSAQSRASSQ